MGDRYPDHIPPALAEVLGQPPHHLHPWWMALRDAGVSVPTRYEGEVAAALHFLIPFAISNPENWRGAAAEELVLLRDGKPFTPALIEIGSAEKFYVGPLTAECVFKAAGITNLSNMQAVLDAVEVALSAAKPAAG